MALKIVVGSPFDYQKNLFGTILKEHSNKLVVRLSEPISVGIFKSNFILLETPDKKETFHSLTQYYAVFVHATLLNEMHDVILKDIFTGTVSSD